MAYLIFFGITIGLALLLPFLWIVYAVILGLWIYDSFSS